MTSSPLQWQWHATDRGKHLPACTWGQRQSDLKIYAWNKCFPITDSPMCVYLLEVGRRDCSLLKKKKTWGAWGTHSSNLWGWSALNHFFQKGFLSFFLWERERMQVCEWGGGVKGDGENLKQTQGWVWSPTWSSTLGSISRPWDGVLSRNQVTNQLSHPGTQHPTIFKEEAEEHREVSKDLRQALWRSMHRICLVPCYLPRPSMVNAQRLGLLPIQWMSGCANEYLQPVLTTRHHNLF